MSGAKHGHPYLAAKACGIRRHIFGCASQAATPPCTALDQCSETHAHCAFLTSPRAEVTTSLFACVQELQLLRHSSILVLPGDAQTLKACLQQICEKGGLIPNIHALLCTDPIFLHKVRPFMAHQRCLPQAHSLSLTPESSK